jgi:hypothetical protein
LKDADAATAHAMRTDHSSFSECADRIKPPTAEEKEEMKKKYKNFIIIFRIFHCVIEFKNVLLRDVKNNK